MIFKIWTFELVSLRLVSPAKHFKSIRWSVVTTLQVQVTGWFLSFPSMADERLSKEKMSIILLSVFFQRVQWQSALMMIIPCVKLTNWLLQKLSEVSRSVLDLSRSGRPSTPRSPYLSPLDFFFWGHTNSVVFCAKLQKIDDLKEGYRVKLSKIIMVFFAQLKNYNNSLAMNVLKKWPVRTVFVTSFTASIKPSMDMFNAPQIPCAALITPTFNDRGDL